MFNFLIISILFFRFGQARSWLLLVKSNFFFIQTFSFRFKQHENKNRIFFWFKIWFVIWFPKITIWLFLKKKKHPKIVIMRNSVSWDKLKERFLFWNPTYEYLQCCRSYRIIQKNPKFSRAPYTSSTFNNLIFKLVFFVPVQTQIKITLK